MWILTVNMVVCYIYSSSLAISERSTEAEGEQVNLCIYIYMFHIYIYICFTYIYIYMCFIYIYIHMRIIHDILGIR